MPTSLEKKGVEASEKETEIIGFSSLIHRLWIVVKQQLGNLSNPCLWIASSLKISKRKKLTHLLSTNTARCISLNATCVMQDMLASRVGICTSVLMDTKESCCPSKTLPAVEHDGRMTQHRLQQFHVLAKCNSKLHGLITEKPFIRKLKPTQFALKSLFSYLFRMLIFQLQPPFSVASL